MAAQSSSSCAVSAAPGLGEALDGALRAIAREHRTLYRALAARLDGRAVSLAVDGEVIPIWVGVRGGAAPPPSISVATSRAALLELADGVYDLSEAIWRDRVKVAGDEAELQRLLDATEIFLHAALRCPSAPPILAAWRDGGAP